MLLLPIDPWHGYLALTHGTSPARHESDPARDRPRNEPGRPGPDGSPAAARTARILRLADRGGACGKIGGTIPYVRTRNVRTHGRVP
ncbi:hypothetical protein GCM10010361_51070 [Streptomyces olivaceiscleroticus]|uniref:Uncharacterized protein n=1 Tax=Streptomyces olivaceiscleroticus TaxID=68245 RepID=A0ABP3KKH7_9ACTN